MLAVERVVLPGALLAALILLALLAMRRLKARRTHQRARLVEVRNPPQADLDGARQCWAALHDALRVGWRRRVGGRGPHVAFELAWSAGGAMRVGLWVAGTVALGAVERAVEGAWPGASVVVAEPTPPLPVGHAAAGGVLRLAQPEWFPLEHAHKVDPLRQLVAAASELSGQETAVVQVLARPVGPRRLARCHQAAGRLRRGNRRPPKLLLQIVHELLDLVDPTQPATTTASRSRGTSSASPGDAPWLRRDIDLIVGKAVRPAFEVQLRYGVAAPRTDARRWRRPARLARARLRRRAHLLASAFGVFTGRNQLHRHRLANPTRTLAARRLGRGDLVGLPELVALAHLPLDVGLPGVARAGAKAVAPRPEIPSVGKVLGDSEAGGRRPVALAVADARSHLHLLGATGSGKSTLLTNLVLQDVRAGRGVVVIDPKGDLVRDLLDRLPEQAAERLVLIDPDERAAPPSLNMLDGPDPDLAVDHLVDPDVFQAAQTLMAERGEDLAKRRSNSYDYLLSGLIRCSHCGKHYVGTCARGNRYTYRYYICFSRQRYGTTTCPSERLPADELDHATLQSLLDTFTQPDFIDRAVHAAAARLGAQREQHQAELATIDAELRRTEAAIKRYMLAFEDGTLDPRTFAPRIKQLAATSDELEARRADLHDTLQRVEAETPDQRTITRLRQRIRDAIQQDTVAAKKNLLHLLIHQIEVHSRDQVIPTFRVPFNADQDQQVRTQPGMVGVTGFEPVASAV